MPSPPDPVTLLEEMVRLPSPSGAETELAEYLVTTLPRLGLAAGRDEAGNVVATTGAGTGPTVLCLGHLDTVVDPVPVRRDGDLLYGRGTVDAKSALAAMFCAAAANPDFPGRLVVAGAVEEETAGSRGARHLTSYLDPDAVVIGEPAGWQRAALGYQGQVLVEVRVTRPGSHPSHPDEKAGEAAARMWGAVAAAYPRAAEAGQRVVDRMALCLSLFKAGLRQARFRLDVRTPPGVEAADVLDRLRPYLDDAQSTVLSAVPAVRRPRTDPVAGALAAAIAQHGGRPRQVLKAGTSDMNLAAQRWPVPMAGYGPGDAHLDHAPDEHVRLSEYRRAVAVLTDALPLLPARLAAADAAPAVVR